MKISGNWEGFDLNPETLSHQWAPLIVLSQEQSL
jgi:hypothetical protein